MATRNVMGAPNPIPHQKRGRERGLESLPLAHPTLEPTNAGTMGMGRARGRNSGPPHIHVLNTLPRCLNPPRDISNPPQRPNLLSPEASSGPPSLESITSSESSESGYEADSD